MVWSEISPLGFFKAKELFELNVIFEKISESSNCLEIKKYPFAGSILPLKLAEETKEFHVVSLNLFFVNTSRLNQRLYYLDYIIQ